MPNQTTMPALGFRGVRWYRRNYPSGGHAFVVVFTRKGRRPYRKSITLRSQIRGTAQAEAFDGPSQRRDPPPPLERCQP